VHDSRDRLGDEHGHRDEGGKRSADQEDGHGKGILGMGTKTSRRRRAARGYVDTQGRSRTCTESMTRQDRRLSSYIPCWCGEVVEDEVFKEMVKKQRDGRDREWRMSVKRAES